MRQICIAFADNIARNGQTPLHGGINAKEKTGHSKNERRRLRERWAAAALFVCVPGVPDGGVGFKIDDLGVFETSYEAFS